VSEGVVGSSAATMSKDLSTIASPLIERQDGAWRVLPIEGRFALVYEDGNGAWSVQHLAAHELKIGPGRVLVGGTDQHRGGYRCFRADRIRRLSDRDTGERIKRNILDWLTRRAEATRRNRAAALRNIARRSGVAKSGARPVGGCHENG
jgi:predicted DNA-binding transcriptional regulator YafY